MDKKLLIPVFALVLLTTMVSADFVGCGFQNYNMYSGDYMPAHRAPLMLNNYHWMNADCCTSPVYNNYQEPGRIFLTKRPMYQFHHVEPCCGN